jgi:hypothetical protein
MIYALLTIVCLLTPAGTNCEARHQDRPVYATAAACERAAQPIGAILDEPGAWVAATYCAPDDVE